MCASIKQVFERWVKQVAITSVHMCNQKGTPEILINCCNGCNFEEGRICHLWNCFHLLSVCWIMLKNKDKPKLPNVIVPSSHAFGLPTPQQKLEIEVIEEGTTWNVVLAQKKHTWQHCFFSRKLSKQLLEDCRPTYLYFLKHNCNISLFLQSVQPSCTSQYSHQKLLELIRLLFFFLYYIAFIFSWCKTFCDVLKGFFCCLESPLGAKVYNCTDYTSIQL